MKVLFFKLLLLLSVTAICWSQVSRGGVRQIRGIVRLENGAPAQYVVVRAQSNQATFDTEVRTDSEGKFIFPETPKKMINLTVGYPGYRSYTALVDMSITSSAYQVIELRRVPPSDRVGVPDDGPHATLDAQQLLVPPKAREEFLIGHKTLVQEQNALDSLTHFDKAIELYPRYAEAYEFKGIARLRMNNLHQAQESLEKAIELDPELPGAQIALGMSLNMQNNFVAAEKPLLKGLQVMPASSDGHFELAKTYFGLARWEDAEVQATKASNLNPKLAEAHILLGNIFLRKRNARASQKEFEEYLKLDPNGPFARQAREMITRISNALAASH